jgi:hypothetical protein
LKKALQIFTLSIALILISVQYSFTLIPREDKGKLQINFKHVVGNEILKLDSMHYKNELGQDFSISKFKYYVGEIHLTNAKGKDFISKDYFLINEDEDLSKQINLSNIPNGIYTSIHFILGVDSLHNCSGAQSGALDPLNAMFWAWNTGYIFLKLEGNSSFSKSPGGMFEYHIGGYKQPTNSIRQIKLDLSSTPLIINSKTSQVNLQSDAAELLKTPNSIDFSVLSSVTDLKNAELIANNYKDMFSVLNVKNEK